jgi:hypothetical protein
VKISGARALHYARVVRPLDSGRDADVYLYGDGLVLRRYRDGRSACEEAATLRYLASVGFAVPEVARSQGPDIVMARVFGPSLAAAVQAGDVHPSVAGETLAFLHSRLHDLTRAGEQSLLHLDLHPLNVLLSSDGPVVIDWANSRRGAPGLDLATTALTLAQVVVTPSLWPTSVSPDPPQPDVVMDVLRSYLRHIPDDFVEFTEEALAMRSADVSLTRHEVALLPSALALLRAPR